MRRLCSPVRKIRAGKLSWPTLNNMKGSKKNLGVTGTRKMDGLGYCEACSCLRGTYVHVGDRNTQKGVKAL
jgi:hypothetical protein